MLPSPLPPGLVPEITNKASQNKLEIVSINILKIKIKLIQNSK